MPFDPQSRAISAVLTHRSPYVSLDNAFALIEGHPPLGMSGVLLKLPDFGKHKGALCGAPFASL
jgi:hypothetical protein